MISLALLAAAAFDAAVIAQTSATLNALGPHPFGSPRNQAAAQFVAAKLKEVGLQQTVLDEFVAGGVTGTNVVARIPGRSDRLLIVATHHDTRRDVQDVSDRSRSLALLVEVGRRVAEQQPGKTWIVASFDGGASAGEGFTHYLETLGRSLALVDGVVLIDAATLGAAEEASAPSLIAPACARGASLSRGIASRDLVAAALARMPSSLDFSFDDPGISLLTQPFIRAFRTVCDPNAASAVSSGLGVIIASDTPYSRRFGERPGATTVKPSPRDTGAVQLGQVAYGALQGIDASTPSTPQSDSWLVVGRSALAGWLVFLVGVATLIPGLVALRADRTRLMARSGYTALFMLLLYFEPEVSLFAGLLPNLVPPTVSSKFLFPALTPLLLLVAAGALGFVRGEVIGSWLPWWLWLGLAVSLFLLHASFGRGRKSPTRAKRGKR